MVPEMYAGRRRVIRHEEAWWLCSWVESGPSAFATL